MYSLFVYLLYFLSIYLILKKKTGGGHHIYICTGGGLFIYTFNFENKTCGGRHIYIYTGGGVNGERQNEDAKLVHWK